MTSISNNLHDFIDYSTIFLIDIMSFHSHFIDYDNIFNTISITKKLKYFINCAIDSKYNPKQNFIFYIDSLIKDSDSANKYFKKLEYRLRKKRSTNIYGHHLIVGNILKQLEMNVYYVFKYDFEDVLFNLSNKLNSENKKNIILSCNYNFYYKDYYNIERCINNKSNKNNYVNMLKIYTFRYTLNGLLEVKINSDLFNYSSYKINKYDILYYLKIKSIINKHNYFKLKDNNIKELDNCIENDYNLIVSNMLISNGSLTKLYYYKKFNFSILTNSDGSDFKSNNLNNTIYNNAINFNSICENDCIIDYIREFLSHYISYLLNNKGIVKYNILQYNKDNSVFTSRQIIIDAQSDNSKYNNSNSNKNYKYYLLINKNPLYVVNYINYNLKNIINKNKKLKFELICVLCELFSHYYNLTFMELFLIFGKN